MSFIDKFFTPFVNGFRQPVESFIRIETMDDETTLVAADGSLISYLRVDGSRQIIGEEEYAHLVESATVKLGARFDRPGHGMQIYFVRDPARARGALEELVRPSHNAARNIGLDLDDLFRERIRHLSHYMVWEECFFVLWTRPSILTKADYARAAKDAKNKKWVQAPNAQFPLAALDILRARHKSYSAGIMSALDELGIRADLLESHDALRAVRNNMFPDHVNDKWRPCLPGDPIPVRASTDPADYSEILWPSLKKQITASSAAILNDHAVRIGGMLWGGCDVVLAPMDPSPFPMLLNRLFDTKVPFRISFMVESGGVEGVNAKHRIATFLTITNPINRTIKNSIDSLKALARSQPVVKLRISLATWAPADKIDLLEDRVSVLMQAVESWGYCQVSNVVGDPLECVMSSVMGISAASTAPTAIAPMTEVMRLLPWQRPSSPFDKGALLLRTPDGKVWPYQTGTNLTTTWFDLIFAQPGAGKSVLMNSLNLGTCLSPGLSRLPFVAVIDIGPSSSGLISLIKESLPQERRHEAAYYRLQMSPQYAINPFDTQLGCRQPLIDERSYLVELLTLLCTPPGAERPYDGIQQLAGLVVDEMYRWRDDSMANAEARPYLPRVDHDIDEAIKKYNVHLPQDPYWWDVVDQFFDRELWHLANLAQRHAVPVLGDAITAARRPQIRALLDETQIGSSSESVINAFERMVTSAIREYPILSSVTRFEITDARVCALDLMDVAPQGDEAADRQTSIMYMLARHALVRSWWMSQDTLRAIPEKYRKYHESRLIDMGETPKRLCYDEFHRTSKSQSVRGQVIRDVREGRKRGVQIVLASQLLDDFDDDMIDLATGVWVLGTAVSERAVENVQTRFGLSNTARHVIRHRLTGPRAGGAPALLVLGTNEGRYEQHLINTLGPVELWALSTSAEDVGIRNRLYTRLGARRARQMLASNFPGGSARSEIKRRVFARAEAGETQTAAISGVIEEIVEELVDMAHQNPEIGDGSGA
ncbi:MAG: type IV secretion protein IcmB [Rhodospirillales bacterium]|nr:type IV secretion protein IcmB [Alphaproteobacteria bacterium]MCB9986538.1 type IV secretion protein IcmB [Rhodospirillales bacterium]USO06926.1 MAG: type IV secretion protein IcmB [Rhodospirillales bacterium]